MADTLNAHPPAPVPLESTFAYERHRPEATLLYQLVETHWPEFVAHMQAHGITVPGLVVREFEAFLRCGRLEGVFYGFGAKLATPSTSWRSVAKGAVFAPAVVPGACSRFH